MSSNLCSASCVVTWQHIRNKGLTATKPIWHQLQSLCFLSLNARCSTFFYISISQHKYLVDDIRLEVQLSGLGEDLSVQTQPLGHLRQEVLVEVSVLSRCLTLRSHLSCTGLHRLRSTSVIRRPSFTRLRPCAWVINISHYQGWGGGCQVQNGGDQHC